jgi:hypothetical protein
MVARAIYGVPNGESIKVFAQLKAPIYTPEHIHTYPGTDIVWYIRAYNKAILDTLIKSTLFCTSENDHTLAISDLCNLVFPAAVRV